MKASIKDALKRLPGAPTKAYPEGVPFATVMAGGSMRVEVFAPGSNTDGRDRQQPHSQDELYFVQGGEGEIIIKGSVLRPAPVMLFLWPPGWRTTLKISALIL